MFLHFPNTLFPLLAAAVVASGVVVHAAKNDGAAGRRRHLQAPNDNVCDAALIEYCTATPWDNTAATTEPSEVFGSNWQDSGPNNSLWYFFTAQSDCVNIYTVTDNVWVQLALYQPTNCGDFGTFPPEIASDDTSGFLGGGGGPPGGPLILGPGPWIQDASVVPGQDYHIQLDGSFGGSGTGNLFLTECGPEFTVSFGGCQTRIINDGDDSDDFNYIRPELPECYASPFELFTFTNNEICDWLDEFTGTIVEDRGCEGVKVQPLRTTSYCLVPLPFTGPGLPGQVIPEFCVTVEVREPCEGDAGILPPADLEGNFEAVPEVLEANFEILEAVTEGYVDDCIVCTAVGEPFD